MLSWYYNLLDEVMSFSSKVLWYGTFFPLILMSWKSAYRALSVPLWITALSWQSDLHNSVKL